jgi:hypothetical protein
MPNPNLVSCPADTWTKVATNVTTGNIWIADKSPNKYLQTYVLTGQAAPAGTAIGIAIVGDGMPIANTVGIDVYIYPIGELGKVRVDV